MHLKKDATLQGGKYRIEKVLGQGGFGITYLGIQVNLNRKVAIKEFFMKEYCNREEDTSHVTVPSMGSKQQVERFRDKFLKEAQNIARLSHPHIIRIYDVFEEHGTAYYVMEYHDHGSLSDLVQCHNKLDETEALRYIRQIIDALKYIHTHNMNHLDIKPSNVLLDDKDNVVLIDFGMSKRYNEDGNQTSTTPVGISHGYAPIEQYKKGGVETFSPETDIYSLGATLYKLLTGQTPPDANDIMDGGFPSLPSHISISTCQAIEAAMQPRRKDRPQNVDSFLSILDTRVNVTLEKDSEETEMVIESIDLQPKKAQSSSETNEKPKPVYKQWLFPFLLCLLTGFCILGLNRCLNINGNMGENSTLYVDTIMVDSIKDQKTNKLNPFQIPVNTKFYATTSPSGANVYVDGKYLGKTPIKNMDIPMGSHTITISLDGYKKYSLKSIFDEKPFILNETLETKNEKLTPQSQIRTAPTAMNNTINGHKYIDLGLSVKWADRNVGASAPIEDGSYYKWKRASLKTTNVVENELNKWRGGTWRLPTKAEFTELLNKCKWIWNSQGYYKVVGPNDNSIILPASGCRNGKTLIDVNDGGYYWCSSLYEGNKTDAYYLSFYSGDYDVTWGNISVERSVRFVSE